MRRLFAATLAVAAVLAGAASADPAPAVSEVIKTYADIAQASYADALAGARGLKTAVDTLIKSPNDATLKAAREAWIAARVPYMQTEVFRFGNEIVDDWEGRVNSWPLDEGLIDYVDAELRRPSRRANALYVANVIANPSIKIDGEPVDASKITQGAAVRHAAGGRRRRSQRRHRLPRHRVPALGPGPQRHRAGRRRSARHRLRRHELHARPLRPPRAVSAVGDRPSGRRPRGDGRQLEAGRCRAQGRHGGRRPGRPRPRILTGIGSLSYGELAGERMKLGLLLHDPEEEHDCFSDNTHNSLYYDAVGIRNLYLATYKRTDGTVVSGPSASDLVRAKSPETDKATRAAIDATIERMGAIVKRAEAGEHYDQLIGEGNENGNAIVEAAIEALIAQSKEFERGIAALDLKAIEFEGSNSLDSPDKVKKQKQSSAN